MEEVKKHTPWRLYKGQSCTHTVIDLQGNNIGTFICSPINAELIVKAVNHHEELVEALWKLNKCYLNLSK